MSHITTAHTHLPIAIILRIKSLWRKKTRGRIISIDGAERAFQCLVMTGKIQESYGCPWEFKEII
jgi:hypothetical protein